MLPIASPLAAKTAETADAAGFEPGAPPHPPKDKDRLKSWLPAGTSPALAWLFAALGAVVIVALALQFALPVAMLPRHVSWNNNEGWDAYWSARALAGMPLYTDAASPISNNYPPLSFYIVGWCGRLIGDPVIAGRILCLAGLLSVAAMIGRIVARFAGARLWSVASAGLFLLLIAAVAQRYLIVNDPQWLAEAPMIASLLLLIGPSPAMPSRRRLIGACLLMLVSGLIKHNQIALPLATGLWLAMYDRRGLAVWLATAAAAGGVAMVALALIFGHPFFDQVMHHQRTIDMRLLNSALKSMLFQLPELALALALAWSRPRDPRIVLLLTFALLAIGIGVGERLGVGVAQNAHFDSAIALVILAGIVLSRGEIGLRSPALRFVALAVMVAPLAIKVLHHAPASMRQTVAARHTDAQWRDAIALLARSPGPVACERTALCYWSGKPYALDISNYGQKLRKGHDPIGLRTHIARRDFAALVELRDHRYRAGRGRLPNDVYQLIDANYRVARILPDNLYVLVPNA